MAWHNQPTFKSILSYKPFNQYYSHTHRYVDVLWIDRLGNENWNIGDYVHSVFGIGKVAELCDCGINVLVDMEEKVEGQTITLTIEFDSLERIEKK